MYRTLFKEFLAFEQPLSECKDDVMKGRYASIFSILERFYGSNLAALLGLEI